MDTLKALQEYVIKNNPQQLKKGGKVRKYMYSGKVKKYQDSGAVNPYLIPSEIANKNAALSSSPMDAPLPNSGMLGQGLLSAAGGVGALLTASANRPDSEPDKSASIGGGALQGIQAGAALGPFGMAGGAIIGGLAGYGSYLKNRDEREAQDYLAKQAYINTRTMDQNKGGNIYQNGGAIEANDPIRPPAFIKDGFRTMSSKGHVIEPRNFITILDNKIDYAVMPKRYSTNSSYPNDVNYNTIHREYPDFLKEYLSNKYAEIKPVYAESARTKNFDINYQKAVDNYNQSLLDESYTNDLFLNTNSNNPEKKQQGGSINSGGSQDDVLTKDKNSYFMPPMPFAINDIIEDSPMVHVQTEKGENIIMPDGGIVKSKAKKKHSQMSKKDVTDILPEGAYVVSSSDKIKFKKDNLDKIKLGHGVVEYAEEKEVGEPVEVSLGDFAKKKESTPAEIAKNIVDKYSVSDKKYDIFTDVTNTHQRMNRLPFLSALMKLSEDKKTKKVQSNDSPKKYDTPGFVEEYKKRLDESVKEQSQLLGDYKDKYSDFYNTARVSSGIAHGIGALGSALQSTEVNPALRSTKYLSKAFQKTPQYLKDFQISQAQKPLDTLARNLGKQGYNASQIQSMLSGATARTQDALNKSMYGYNMNDLAQEQKYNLALQNVEDANAANIAGATNERRGLENAKIARTLGYLSQGITKDASLRGQALATDFQLAKERASLGQGALNNLAQYQMSQDMLEKMRNLYQNQNSGNNTQTQSSIGTNTTLPTMPNILNNPELFEIDANGNYVLKSK